VSVTVETVTTSWAVVVAAGSGSRYGGRKQFEMLGDRRVVDWSLAAARAACDGVVLVVAADEVEGDFDADVQVSGGESRTESVRRGLAAVPSDVEVVAVHDAARPGASADLFRGVISAVVAGADAAVPGLDVTDTVKRVTRPPNALPLVVETVPRADLMTVQTPQAFRRAVLAEAHAQNGDATDDAALVEQARGTVVVVDGESAAHKITTSGDLALVAHLMGLD
jgi:2-C-methyl-D-erythritol 4-phosphate cytidylyltransferase